MGILKALFGKSYRDDMVQAAEAYDQGRYTQALEICKSYAERGKGFEEAQYILGRIYIEGEGVRQNCDVALKYFEEAALRSYLPAQKFLSELWEYTEIPKLFENLSEAARIEASADFLKTWWPSKEDQLIHRGLKEEDIQQLVTYHFRFWLRTYVEATASHRK